VDRSDVQTLSTIAFPENSTIEWSPPQRHTGMNEKVECSSLRGDCVSRRVRDRGHHGRTATNSIRASLLSGAPNWVATHRVLAACRPRVNRENLPSGKVFEVENGRMSRRATGSASSTVRIPRAAPTSATVESSNSRNRLWVEGTPSKRRRKPVRELKRGPRDGAGGTSQEPCVGDAKGWLVRDDETVAAADIDYVALRHRAVTGDLITARVRDSSLTGWPPVFASLDSPA